MSISVAACGLGRRALADCLAGRPAHPESVHAHIDEALCIRAVANAARGLYLDPPGCGIEHRLNVFYLSTLAVKAG